MGGYSQINAEINLLKAAAEKGNYLYYHLLSGQDLPIKSNSYIRDFFENNKGKNFIRFQQQEFAFMDRVRYYYFLQDRVGRKKSLLYYCNKASIMIQKLFRVNRNKGIKFQKGTNWFSITDELARYIISKEKWIEKVFKHTYCCDEVFVQTIVNESEYFQSTLANREYNNDPVSIMRLIDWSRGNPYTFTIDDFQMIQSSEMLWARKFDENVDDSIIQLIFKKYCNEIP